MADSCSPVGAHDAGERSDAGFSPAARWRQLRFYTGYLWQFVVLQRQTPLVYGIAPTDRCNLACRGCRIANTGRPDMTWDQLGVVMRDAYRRGFRELYFTGGEPMLWRDAGRNLSDAILEAKRIGFFHVHVYTNGLCGLDTPADLAWVSIDGLPGAYAQRRGNHFHQVERAVRSTPHGEIAAIYVVDRNSAEQVEPFLAWVVATEFPVLGVMFYFHTPYYGRDELFLSAEDRAPIIDRLLDCIGRGLPVLNSRAGLLALQSGDWPRRFGVAAVCDVDGESVCCRASDATCADCGYAACTELTELQRLRPSAILGHDEVLVNDWHRWLVRSTTRTVRRYLVGPEQRWVFERPAPHWAPSRVERTSLYLHVPFCRHFCPYCPYTKVPYRESHLAPYTKAAIAEVDWWAEAIGPAEVTSVYIGGGTPTLALDSVDRILQHVRGRFHLSGDICIETNPGDLDEATIRRLHDMGVELVSLGVQSFQPEKLAVLGRDYAPPVAERALSLLANSDFASVNADLMFALPQQTAADVVADLAQAARLGADQITTYPLFTFPYTSVGKYLALKTVQMPNLRMRHSHYRAISDWCAQHDFERVSVWGFKHGAVPRYSSVTRDGYIGIGPGAGSHLPDGFVLNTFDLESWMAATCSGRSVIALRMPFAAEMAGWWWLYWRFYDTHIPVGVLGTALGTDASKARHWLKALEWTGLAERDDEQLDLTERGAFWLHLVQNYFRAQFM